MYDVRPVISRDSPRFMDKLRIFMRTRNLAYRTEKTYCYWIKFYFRYHERQHPASLGSRELSSFSAGSR